MNLDVIHNVITLIVTIIGLLICLFHYIEMPKKGWLFSTIFFLMLLLSDYYWTLYTLVMHRDPEISAVFAYLGYNIGYLFLFFAVLVMQREGSRRYFNLLMLLPIPLNIYQLTLYLQYGGFFNNIYQCTVLTLVAVICLKEILYCYKNRRSGIGVPAFHLAALLYVTCAFGMWTASCFFWGDDWTNPYYYFELANYLCALFFGFMIKKDYEKTGLEYPEKTTVELKFQLFLQSIVAVIIFIGCVGGYVIADWLKKTIPAGTTDERLYDIIAIMLFVISLFLVVLILAVVLVIANRYKNAPKEIEKPESDKKVRLNFGITLVITLALMIFTIVYNSSIFYKVSVTEVYNLGEDKAWTTSAELENYLSMADSVLRVTADTIDMMVKNGESQQMINSYLVEETSREAEQFDENFTGIYAYINGEYMDGSGWVPPEGYVVEERNWYQCAVEAKGSVVIVPPYVDAQTGSVVITIVKLITDGMITDPNGSYNVVALDVIVNHVKDVAQQVDLSGKGYAMIINKDGLIVAHRNNELDGKNISEVYGDGLLNNVLFVKDGSFNGVLNGAECTLFVNEVLDQWYVVLVVPSSELFEDIHVQLTVNIIVSIIVFALISFIYYLGYKNEQLYGKQMEELKVSRQKQEYESEVLRLEKTAADEANKAKSGFLADMSHEIRTPINAILGMNEMILREAENKRVLEYARNVETSGRNLLQLINGILDFSKIEDGKMEIVPVRYSVRSLITYLATAIMEKARAKDLELNIEADKTLPSELYGDDMRVNQVITNLLTNAVKYTHVGSVTLVLQNKMVVNDKVLLHVEVRDTGIGIRQKDMEKLFESFERLDVVKNRTIEGTGLGMSITTRLLNLMGSELNVESKYGEGSVFSFDLWQKIENPEPMGEYKLSAGELGGESYSELFHAPSASILIVDDTKMNIVVAVNFLKNTQIRIDTALSGDEAIGLADKNEYDIILMDQRMPGMNGTEALKAIKALESRKNTETPIICLTADAIRGAKERYIAEGFSDYLTKPVEGHELENMILAYLPEDKIIRDFEPVKTTAAVNTGEEDPLFEALRGLGIDTKMGLNYSQGDSEFYKKILSVYASESEHKGKILRESYSNRDWENYTVMVHSLKSTSRTLGARELSELAKQLEAASRQRDDYVIRKGHDRMMSMYDELVALIRKYIEPSLDEGTSEGDDEILEFMPE
ncbi:MAG: response regulator [Lachnospiraceae bacterium]|nr:response regulator [Lachnospiraceae bacterium]